MAKDLEETLVNQKAKLGDAEKPHMDLGDHLEYIESLLEQGAGGGGSGKSVPPTLNLFDLSGNTLVARTTITEEEKTNLENGLYNQVMYAAGDYSSMYSPSKLFSIGEEYVFIQFKIVANADETFSYSSMVLDSITIGEKNTSNEYPITVTEIFTINPPSAGGGSNIDKLDIEFKFNGNTTLTQEQVTLVNSYANKYVYVKFNEGLVRDNVHIGYVLNLGDLGTFISIVSEVNISGDVIIQSSITIRGTTATHKEETISFSETNSGKFLKTNAEGNPEWASVGKTISLFGKYSILVPDSSTDTNILPLPSDASSKTYTLQTVNGVLTWTDAIGDINTILDNINGEVI